MDLIQSVEDLNETKVWPSQVKGTPAAWWPWAGALAFTLELNTIVFPGSPACWVTLQVMAHVNFYNCMSQFPTINLFVHVHTHPIGSASLKNPNIHAFWKLPLCLALMRQARSGGPKAGWSNSPRGEMGLGEQAVLAHTALDCGHTSFMGPAQCLHNSIIYWMNKACRNSPVNTFLHLEASWLYIYVMTWSNISSV